MSGGVLKLSPLAARPSVPQRRRMTMTTKRLGTTPSRAVTCSWSLG
jgi:hypothetical protein